MLVSRFQWSPVSFSPKKTRLSTRKPEQHKNPRKKMTTRVKPTPVFGAIALDGDTVVPLPFSQLLESLGKTLYYQHQHQTIPVLCRQHHGDNAECRGLHLEPTFAAKLGNSPYRPCCAYCGDAFTRSLYTAGEGDERLQLLGPIFFNGVMYPMERLMVTQAIIAIIPNESVASSRVCKEHLEGYCPRSKDCALLHLCRERADACAGPFYTTAPGSAVAVSVGNDGASSIHSKAASSNGGDATAAVAATNLGAPVTNTGDAESSSSCESATE